MAEHEPSIGETSEWYTPPEIFAALRLTFDLDPCSPGPGHWVPAKKVYTEDDDGLVQPWHGLVFMNPPFGGRNGHVVWMQKFFRHANGIAIVRAYTSSAWWHEEMHKAEMILFPRGKTKFHQPRRHHRHGARSWHRAGRHGRRRLRSAAAVGARHGLGLARFTEGRVIKRLRKLVELTNEEAVDYNDGQARHVHPDVVRAVPRLATARPRSQAAAHQSFGSSK